MPGYKIRWSMRPSSQGIMEQEAFSEAASLFDANMAKNRSPFSLTVQAGMAVLRWSKTHGLPSRASPFGSFPFPQALPLYMTAGIT